uniref:Uncharacterized protein n=1 Tax=Neurospora crassa TaxID=5141 RepID=Q5F0G8_NEUCS|nr:unknown [Neurospora crassa]
MDITLQKAVIITVARIQSNEILAFLMRDYSEFSTADFVLVILMEIHRRGHISDRTVHIDGQPLNDEVVNALNEVNETVSTATDLVDRTTSLVEGQGGEIAARELDRVRNIFDYANDIRRNLNEILARLPEEGIALRNIDIDEFRTITTDFLDAFEQFMNIL